MNLREMAEATHLLQELFQIVKEDFGGRANFRQVLRRMKEFDERVQQLGGVDHVMKLLEKHRS